MVQATRVLTHQRLPGTESAGNEGAVSFLTDSHLSEVDRTRIAHGNADELLRLN